MIWETILDFIDFYFPYILAILTVIGLIFGIYAKRESIFKIKSIKSATPVLDKYSRDLIALAKDKKLDEVIGREKEVRRIIQILCRRTKNNAILIGEAGVGKTAIAEGLALSIVDGQVPEILKDKRLLALNIGGLLAGTKYRGEFERRVEMVSQEILDSKRAIILFIDEIQSLTQANESTGAVGAANLLKPFLARGDLQVIGAATPEDYYKYIQNDTSLERRFQPVLIKEPTSEEALRVLRGIRKNYEEYHQVKITDEIIEAAVSLTEKYLTDRYFPDKAIDLIDETAAKVNLSKVRAKKKLPVDEWPEISINDLEEILFQWSSDVTALKQKKELLEKDE